MTREEREEAIKVIQNFPVGSTEERKAVLMAVQALEQMPVTTTTGEEGVIYYPQVEGVTPTVVKQEPCEDAISRQAAIEAFKKWICFDYKDDYPIMSFIGIQAILEEQPSVNPQPKTGHWIRVDKDKCKCDQCEVISFIAMYPNGDINYCPNCGADMRGTENE